MSLISHEVEIAFKVASADAHSRRHEFLTLEHLLFALLHDAETSGIIEYCGGEPGTIKNELNDFLSKQFTPLPEGSEAKPEPTIAFQRTIQRDRKSVV